MPQVQAGKLRVLGVSSAQKSVLVPNVPTVASGLPGYEVVSKYAMFAPIKTPTPIINRLNKEIVQILKQPDVKKKFLDAGAEPIGNSPQQATDMIKSEHTRLGKVIKEAGIKEE